MILYTIVRKNHEHQTPNHFVLFYIYFLILSYLATYIQLQTLTMSIQKKRELGDLRQLLGCLVHHDR